MELRHLRYFVAAAECLHFSRAAAQLHVTQPALSRQIRDLEEELGAALFRRHGTATMLTAAGSRFLGRAREILDLAERAAHEARAAGSELRLGHYGTLWVDRYGPALRAFGKRFPKIALQAVEKTPVELVAALRRGEVDVALIGPAGEELRGEFAVRRLEVMPALVAMSGSHPLAKRRRLALEELRGQSWIVWDERDFPSRVAPLREAAAAAGFEPRIAGTADSVASLLVQLATGRSLGYVLPMTRKIPHAGVVLSELRPPGIGLAMDVVWCRDAAADSPVAALVELLATVRPAQ